jgi:hypothetical protein
MENTSLFEPWMRIGVYLLLPLLGILVPAYVTLRNHRPSQPAEPVRTPLQDLQERMEADHAAHTAKLDRMLTLTEQSRGGRR